MAHRALTIAIFHGGSQLTLISHPEARHRGHSIGSQFDLGTQLDAGGLRGKPMQGNR